MKKALQITLSGVLFTIEEDAYEKLHSYLEETRRYFASYNDTEIMKDIEARIAEQLMDKKDSIVTIEDVDGLISKMGKVEDFKSEDGGHQDAAEPAQETAERGRRRLYRNPDDVVIAGVASGLAAYFGIDPLIVRLLFIVLSFGGGGTGIIIYIILALILPKAETPAEKLQMNGGPMNLDSFKKNLREQASNFRNNGKDFVNGGGSGFRNFVEKLIRLFGKLVMLAAKIIVVAVGAVAMAVGVGLLFGATFALVNLIFNVNSPYIELPLTAAIGAGPYYLLVILGYIAAIIPVIFIIGSVISLIKRKFVFKANVLLGMAGAWVVTVIIFGTMLIHFLPEIRERIAAMPRYQTITRTEDLSGFTKIEAYDFESIHLVQSPEFSIVAEGAQANIEKLDFKVDNETLVIRHSHGDRLCIICIGDSARTEITIGMPTTTDITLHDAVGLDNESLAARDISLALSDASHAALNLRAASTTITLSDASRLTLTGSSTALSVTAHDVSRFDGSSFPARRVTAAASDASRIMVNALESLGAAASDIGRIVFSGNPKVTSKQSDLGKVESENSPTVNYADNPAETDI